jgi:hypothetical protein
MAPHRPQLNYRQHRLPRAIGLLAVIAAFVAVLAPAAVAREAAPARAKAKICREGQHHHCIKAPKNAIRPAGRSQSRGGPSNTIPLPTDGGLGGAGFNAGESAIAWAQTLKGSTNYAWYCERFVENALNTSGRFPSAWAGAQSLGLRSGWAPRGALVFFRPHWTNQNYGHVGISLGGTSMISALAKVEETNIAASKYWSSLYAGWAYAPASWPGRNIVPNPPANDTTPNPPASGPVAAQLTAPAAGTTVSGTLHLSASTANAAGVSFDAYYATNPNDVSTVGWHHLGNGTGAGANQWALDFDTHEIPNQGNGGWGTVNIAATALDSGGQLSNGRDYHRVTIANGTPTSPPVNRQAVTSYNQMRGGAPYNGYFNNAWQPFTAQSNTITYLGATVGTPALASGGTVPYDLTLRLCSGQPPADGSCPGQLAQATPQIVNYGNTAADIGGVAVKPGQTYWVEWLQPAAAGGSTWVTYWWAGGSAIGASDQMQAIVQGYNR